MPSVETNLCQIVVNGSARNIPVDLTLDQVLVVLEVDPQQVAVEKDKLVVRRSAWSSTLVAPGSHLEIVQFVGGG